MSGQTDMAQRVADNIVLAMERAEVSTAELSRETGLHERQIRRYRKCEHTPGEDNLSLIGVGTGIQDIAWFYTDHSSEAATAA